MAIKWQKRNIMNNINDMFDTMGNVLQKEIDKIYPKEMKLIKRCRTCVHRKRYALNEYSEKVIQYCELKPSKRSNSGYKTINVTDVACTAYKEK